MRIIHTADWHLGHTLGGFSREREHQRFLSWLLDRLEEERANALLICGDVFEHGNPPATAQHRYYDFLASARRRMPRLQIVVIGGNHDAAPRLDAPRPLLNALGVHVVGGLPRDADGNPEPAAAVVPLLGESGETEAWCAAIPHLRSLDLGPPPKEAPDPIVGALEEAFERIIEAAAARRTNGEALLALAHGHFAGGRFTDESERPIFANAHAIPVSVFPDDVTYAALGHLHFAQDVGGRREVRYAGSPIPLSMAERGYAHQVMVVDVEGARLTNLRPLIVPRAVELVRIPEEHAPLADVIEMLRALPKIDRPDEERPFLEVRVRLDKPAPDLRARVEAALEGKGVRLVRIQRELPGEGEALGDVETEALAMLCPRTVLARLYERTYGAPVPPEIAAAFDELLEGGAA